MKNAIVSVVLAAGILVGSCSTSRDVRVTERNDDGTVIKKERRVDNDGIVIKKTKRNRDNGRDGDNRDTKIRIKRDKDRDRDGGLFDNDDKPAIIIDTDRD